MDQKRAEATGKRSSRRRMLKMGASAIAGGSALAAQSSTSASQLKPAVTTNAAQRRFKAWVSRGEGPGRTTLHEVTLRPIGGRQVVVRTEATNLCYSNCTALLGVGPCCE